MKRVESLFQLIHSLSATEKRYFKLFAEAMRDGSNYVKLFDAINNQDEYDEEAIKQKFKNETFIKQLHVTKHGLYALVLKSLRNFYHDFSIDFKLKNLLQDIEILIKKGLYEQARYLINKGKEIVKEHNKSLELIELLILESSILSRERLKNITLDKINLLFDQKQHLLSELKTIFELNRQYFLFYATTKAGTSRSTKESQQTEKIIDYVKAHFNPSDLPPRSRLSYHSIFIEYYNKKKLGEEMYFHQHEIMKIIESDPHAIKGNPRNYIVSLFNMLLTLNQLKREKEFNIILLKIVAFEEKNRKSINENLKAEVFSGISLMRLSHYNRLLKFDKAIEIVPSVEIILKKYENTIREYEKISICLAIALSYFHKNNHHAALRWSNKILNRVEESDYIQLYCQAKILNLFIHFELGNEDLLESTVKSTRYYLEKRNKLYEFEIIVLDFIKKVVKNNSFENYENELKILQKKLTVISKDSFQYNAFEDMNLLHWLNAKLKKNK